MTLAIAMHALAGGLLIGAGAAVLLLLNGRVAGVSGVLANVLEMRAGEQGWRVAFLLGLAVPALIVGNGHPRLPGSLMLALVAGLMVGMGTRLGSGCTSGHGVCGIANLSLRSLTATAVFMFTAVVTVWLVRHGAHP
ncbi:MAG TPA: YeeE/YedE family protein [Steroidobacteraceae bacterium]|nr:YeeE/YedE family protein [Steroidobacteraceae bacterium]